MPIQIPIMAEICEYQVMYIEIAKDGSEHVSVYVHHARNSIIKNRARESEEGSSLIHIAETNEMHDDE